MATTVADLMVQIGGDSSEAEAALGRVDSKTKATAQGTKDAGLVMLGAGTAMAAGIGFGIKAAVNFDGAMNGVRAVTNATGKDFDSLRQLALKIGTDTVFGATQGAQAIEELAKAGVSTADIMNGAAMGAANLAAAAGIDMPQAAIIMSNAMNVFGISGENAAHIADVFAAAANKSAADVSELAIGMSQSALVGDMFGVSFEDMTAILAEFSDSGLRGSDAGTSLKTMLLSLLTPVGAGKDEIEALGLNVRDAEGNFIGFSGAADELHRVLDGLGPAQRDAAMKAIFGTDAIRAGNILYADGADTIKEYQAAVDDTGAANRMASARMQGVSGAIEQLKGSVETAAIVFGDMFTPYVLLAANALRKVMDGFTSLSPQMQKVLGSLFALTSLVLLASGGWLVFGARIKSTLQGFQVLAKSGFGVARMMRTIGVAMRFMIGPWGLVILAIAALYLAYKTNFLGFGDGVRRVLGWIIPKLETAAIFIDNLRHSIALAFSSKVSVNDLMGDFSGLPKPLRSAVHFLLLAGNAVGFLFRSFKKGGFKGLFAELPQQLGILAKALTGSSAFGQFVKNFTAVMIPAVAAFASAVARFFSGVIVPAIASAVAFVLPILGRFSNWFAFTAVPAIASFVSAVAGFITGTIVPAIVSFVTTVWPYLLRFGNWFTFTAIPAIVTFATAVYNWIVGTIVPAIVSFVTTVWPYLVRFGQWFTFTAIPAVVAFATTVYNWITGVLVPTLVGFWTTVWPYLQSFADWFTNVAVPAVIGFGSTVGSTVTTVVAAVSGIWDGVSGALTTFANWFTGGVATVQAWASGITSTITGLVSSVRTGAANLVSAIAGIYTGITAPFVNIYNFFYNIGWSVIAGMSAGIQSIWSTLTGWMDSIIGQIDRIPGWLRPGSPAKTAIPWGASLVQGIAAGVQNAMPELQSAMGTVQTNMVPTLPASTAGAGVAGTGTAATTAGSSVTIGPGAVQITITGAVDSSTAMELRNGVYQALERLIAGGVAGVPA